MAPAFGLVLLLINSLLFIHNRRMAIILYLTFALILPLINIFNLKISYEILFFPIFIFLTLITGGKFYINSFSLYLISYFFIYVVSTVISSLFYDSNSLYIHIFGTVRLIILYIILINEREFNLWYKEILIIVLLANIVVMLVQFLFPSSIFIFHNLYAKDSAIALDGMLNIGYFTRLSGTFNNIAPAAFFFLLTIIVYFYEYLNKNSFRNILILCFSVLCGLATSSNTFIVGMPILFGINWLLKYKYRKYAYNGMKLGYNVMNVLLFVMIILVIASFFYYSQNILEATRYINKLSVENLFYSRYSVEKGIVIDAFNIFKDNWLFGVGATSLIGEFLGDSLYVVILHNTGIIGLLIISMFLSKLAVICIKDQDTERMLLIISILIVGVGSGTIFSLSGIYTLAYISPKINSFEDSHLPMMIAN